MTDRYLKSSHDITISYNKFEAEKENSLSLLIASVVNFSSCFSYVGKSATDHKITLDHKATNLFKYFNDNNGPVITNNHIKSGVKALGLQTVCPFRAFAEIRLGANNNFNLEIGPANWLRGQVIHEILQNFYTEHSNKAKILELINNRNVFINYLNNLIFDILINYKKQYLNIFKLGIIKVEQDIILKVLINFIELEVNREDFEVLAVEHSFLFKINDISFNVRVDRIDKINSEDQLLIIDYKTTEQNINNLFKDELVDPQLPIYLFLEAFNNPQSSTSVSAVVFAEMLLNKAVYKGIGRKEIIKGCIKTDYWDELKSKWYKILNKTARDFSSGNAIVKPLYQEQTCRTCHLAGLCRKDEVWI